MFPVILSKHFHGAVDTLPTVKRFDDATLISLMRDICDARPAAKQSDIPAGRAMIRAMAEYHAAMLNACGKTASEETAAYHRARGNREDTVPAELAVLHSVKNPKLHEAFDAMLVTGQNFLFAKRHPILHRIFG